MAARATARSAHSLGPLPKDYRTIIEVPVKYLYVSRDAQREINEERVSQIAQEFDWNKFEMPTCSEFGKNQYRVIEGQHRVAAVKKRDPDAIIRILVCGGKLEPAQEAKIALGIATARKPHTPFSKWELKVRQGLPHEVEAEEVLRMHGLRLGQKVSPYTIACVAKVGDLIHANKQTPDMGAETLNLTLEILQTAYPKEEQENASVRWSSDLFKAVGELVLRNRSLDAKRLAATMRERIAQHWLSEAQTADVPTWLKIADILSDRYNKGLRNERKKIGLGS